MSNQHIPAWRRLGLKLKSEDAASPTAPSVNGAHAAKKRKLSQQDQSSSRGLRQVLATNINGINGSPAFSSPSLQASETPSPGKRKSVSFTPDTKVEDGGPDLNQLYEDAYSDELELEPYIPWEAESSDSDSDSDSDSEPWTAAKPAGESQSPSLGRSVVSKEEKQPEPGKETKVPAADSRAESPSEYVSPQLRYLTEFNTARGIWKFNKAKETWLIKNALDLDKVPSSYDSALAGYMAEIKNEGPRSRLRAAAQEALDADDAELRDKAPKEAELPKLDKINSDAHFRQAYQRAIDAFSKRARQDVYEKEERELLETPAWSGRLKRRFRAQKLVWSVQNPLAELRKETPRTLKAKEAALESSQKQALRPGRVVEEKTATPQPGEKRKRRRRRLRSTGVPDDDSESSDSQSDSDAS